MERYQVLDLLTSLVDKSLVVAESTSGRTRYRLLETVRQYALEKVGESCQADAVRARHRDYYSSMAAMLDTPAPRALAACGGIAVYNPEVARPYFAEAIGLARTIGDGLRLGQMLAWQAFGESWWVI